MIIISFVDMQSTSIYNVTITSKNGDLTSQTSYFTSKKWRIHQQTWWFIQKNIPTSLWRTPSSHAVPISFGWANVFVCAESKFAFLVMLIRSLVTNWPISYLHGYVRQNPVAGPYVVDNPRFETSSTWLRINMISNTQQPKNRWSTDLPPKRVNIVNNISNS